MPKIVRAENSPGGQLSARTIFGSRVRPKIVRVRKWSGRTIFCPDYFRHDTGLVSWFPAQGRGGFTSRQCRQCLQAHSNFLIHTEEKRPTFSLRKRPILNFLPTRPTEPKSAFGSRLINSYFFNSFHILKSSEAQILT